MPQIFKSPLAQSESLMPSLRDRWNRYLDKGIGAGENIDYWNKEIEDIESKLPFENDEEHKKWLDLSATWKGEPEWPELTNKILDRIDNKENN